LTEILETFLGVFCFSKSRINENGGKTVDLTLFKFAELFAVKLLDVEANSPVVLTEIIIRK